jgi:Leucine-rich repeat (LRR) protein
VESKRIISIIIFIIFTIAGCGTPKSDVISDVNDTPTVSDTVAPELTPTPTPSVAPDNGYPVLDASAYSGDETTIQISRTNVDSLDFLAGFKNLDSLDIHLSELADSVMVPYIASLKKLVITDPRACELAQNNPQTEMALTIYDKYLDSFELLDGYKNLTEITFDNCTFADDIALPHCDALLKAEIFNCAAPDVQILRNNTQITDLYLGGGMSDISLLAQFTDLTYLQLTNNDVTDLSPLAGCLKLESLVLVDGNYRVNSLKPLYGLPNLTWIQMDQLTYENLPVEDLDYFGSDTDDRFNKPGSIIEID